MTMRYLNDKFTILIVDDLPDNIKILGGMLKNDYSVIAATSGAEALERVSSMTVDLILLDVMMPEMDGYEVYQKLKANPATSDIAVIFVTTKNEVDDEARGLALGAVDYITKPVNQHLVRLRVHNHLKIIQATKMAQHLLNENQAILQGANEGIASLNIHGNIQSLNPVGAHLLFHGADTWPDILFQEMVVFCPSSENAQTSSDLWNAVLREGKSLMGQEGNIKRLDGSLLPIELSISPIGTGPEITGLVCIFRDITNRKKQQQLEMNCQVSSIAISALMETTVEALPLQRQLEVALDIIMTVSWLSLLEKGAVFLIDEATGELVLAAQKNFPPLQQQQCARIQPGQCLCGQVAQSQKTLFKSCVDHQHTRQFPGMEDHGHWIQPIFNAKKELLGIVALYFPAHSHPSQEEDSFISTFISYFSTLINHRRMEQKMGVLQQQMYHLAHHDKLTGLPNRRMLEEFSKKIFATATRNNTQCAILYFDLDRFKPINDTFGHEYGDRLLQQVANRVQESLRKSDLLARIGGDEFIILMAGIQSVHNAVQLSEKMIALLNQPFNLKGQNCHIGCSIGISLFPDHGQEIEILMKQADKALYKVKEHGRNHFSIFSPANT
ncbi:MAG: diguanylate cyclase [Magnetococcus sp. THC-1_WYH]